MPEDLPLPELTNVCHPVVPLIITKSEVESKLNKLKDCKSVRPDTLEPCFLRNLSAQLSTPLSLIFNKSLREGDVPTTWRMANILL